MPQFAKGASGNPLGRPKGARNRVTMAVEALLDGDAQKLTRKAIGLALRGDTTALRLCLERIAPTPKDRVVYFPLADVRSVTDLPRAIRSIVAATAQGQIRPSEAEAICKLLEHYRSAEETADLETRIEALERRYDQDR